MVSHCACPTRAFRGRALHEHRRPSSPPLSSLSQGTHRTRVFQFSIALLEGVAEAALHCAYRTSTVSSCAFCEQEGHLATPSPPLGSGSKFLSQCRLLQSFLIEIQGPGHSFPRSLSQLHKSLLYINQFHSPFFLVMRLVLALHFFRA